LRRLVFIFRSDASRPPPSFDSSSFYFPPPPVKSYAIKAQNSFAAAAKLKHRRNKTTYLIPTVIVE